MGTIIWTTIGAVLTLSIYSFLYKDNPFYKFAEHLVVGVSAGYYLVIYYFNFIHPNVFSPVFLLRLGSEPIGFGSFPWWMALIPGVLGVLLYTRFFPKSGWIGRWALGIYVGGYAGLGISPVMQARVIEQLRANALALAPSDGDYLTNINLGVVVAIVLVYLLFSKRQVHTRGRLAAGGAILLAVLAGFGAFAALDFQSRLGIASTTNILLVFGLLGTLTYFFFSMRHVGILGWLARVGIIFIMVGFGASFGYTVMSRISLLIGRVGFLLHDWLHLID